MDAYDVVEFGDVENENGGFGQAHDTVSCALFNLETGCLAAAGVEACGGWQGNDIIENAVDPKLSLKVNVAEQKIKEWQLAFIKKYPDFKTSKNKDVKELVENYYGAENIEACTQ